ncbi:Der GTPase-activating protein YihI [Paraglaciecola arctica]|uniref:Der GTPase-activating protein YihI n=1 Tax=Paraglaciecola arctica TaxID=1128911 RepID=UPI001C076864|nr:Der GTPase-activating protein YihI [Paraglaciecola arctica]MBU3003474.1 GTPase-activating protein [Paraglaciecola arctica]
MARQKKSRKVGKIGVAKTSSNVRKPTEKRVKKHLGKPAGSRNSAALTDSQGPKKVVKDPRHGSKKPVSLIVETSEQKTVPKKIKYFSPTQELAAIEQDPRLATLLNKLEKDKKISREDQQYVDQTLARHKVLCDLLGISNDDENHQETSEQEIDVFSQFESIDINDFKD